MACIAFLSGTTLEDVVKNGEALGLPKTGPYWNRGDGDFLAKPRRNLRLDLCVWKEVTKISASAELCIAIDTYDADREFDRTIVIHPLILK
ncbi:hypothetical protein CR152_29940 [Massilia violaceinigra]|uniref:Uncharacterized protein n=1 Tax=Massilia violaceinigra TaxID=2045208 RepID=A0A2D2DTF3_9BURK|nr:hypothetical protein CR152_29940 [Massilia violaceinigra]